MAVYPDDTRIWGTDVSFYQDDNNTLRGIDFEQMKEQGAQFVFIRAGQHTWSDSDFRSNWEAAREAGLLRGAYWFLDARVSGKIQARKFRDVLGQDWGELPPTVDYEHAVRVVEQSPKKKKTVSVLKYNTPAQLDEFLYHLDSPVLPILYTGFYYWRERGSRDPKYAAHPLWIAGYGTDHPLVPLPWQRWDFWQFTDKGPGTVLGAESLNIDLDYVYDRETLDRLAASVASPSVDVNVLQILKTTPRLGAELDVPEGSRYIQLSETLVNKMIDRLE